MEGKKSDKGESMRVRSSVCRMTSIERLKSFKGGESERFTLEVKGRNQREESSQSTSEHSKFFDFVCFLKKKKGGRTKELIHPLPFHWRIENYCHIMGCTPPAGTQACLSA